MAIVTPIHHHGMGWKKDLPDSRDRRWSYAQEPRPHPRPQQITAPPPTADTRHLLTYHLDQGNIGCHDDQTEVLTDGGWMRWADYRGEELLATVSPLDHALEFQAPLALQQYEYDGLLYKSDHDRLSFALTPNHRMYSRRWNQRQRTLDDHYEFREIQDLGWYSGLLASPSGFVGTDLLRLRIGIREYAGDDLIALLALMASDGWVGGTDSNWNTVSFCCFREDRLPMVRDFANRMGWSEVPGRTGVWKWSDGDLAHWLRSNLFTGPILRSPYKRVPDLVKVASQRQIENFLLFFGDQHHDPMRNRQFYSSSRRMIDDLQELLLRVGKRSSIYERSPRDTMMRDGRRIDAENCVADITLTEWVTDRLSIERKTAVVQEPYQGPVFCATVPNSTLITRRDGQVLISGNSCTANSASYIHDGLRALEGLPPLYLSRLFQYYNSRIPDNTVNSDSGASIRNTIKAMVDYGACPESMWPYDIPRFRERPDTPCYTFGADRQVIEYLRVSQSLTELMGAIASGYPVIYGMMIYRGFEDLPAHGMVPMPSPGEGSLGGHSGVLCHHWTDQQGTVYFTDKNTWGTSHGAGGFAFLPAQYILDPQLCDDFWIIRKVETEAPLPPPPDPVPPIPVPPSPPSPIYNVGPGVLKLMDRLGDRPRGHEKYFPQGPYSKSVTEGEQYFYEWEELTDTVKATPVNRVLMGTR